MTKHIKLLLNYRENKFIISLMFRQLVQNIKILQKNMRC